MQIGFFKLVNVVLLFMALTQQAYACLNGKHLFLSDSSFLVYADHQGSVPRGHNFMSEDVIRRKVKELDSLYLSTSDLDWLSDKGLLLIVLGEYQRAVDLYLRIEKAQPGLYATASNIGTAYELLGQNKRALEWIRKAVGIDSSSHNGSEWIHVKILEAKLNGKPYYTGKFILGEEFGTALIPESDLSFEKRMQLSDQLYYQLNERISFVKPEDTIIAELLFDLGNMAFLAQRYHDAKADYILAQRYGLRSTLIQDRLKEVEKRLANGNKNVEKEQTVDTSFSNWYILAGVLSVLLIGTLWLLRKKSIK